MPRGAQAGRGPQGVVGVVGAHGLQQATPLGGEQGHALGSLCVIDFKPRAWRMEDRSALASLAEPQRWNGDRDVISKVLGGFFAEQDRDDETARDAAERDRAGDYRGCDRGRRRLG